MTSRALPSIAALACAAVLTPEAPAQTPAQPFFNVVTLDAAASADVPTDTLTMVLFTEEQGPDPAAIAARVNARLDQALASARAQRGVEARSGSYQTNPVYDRGNQIAGWRTRAEIIVESRDFKAVGALAGSLQPAMKLGSMSFSLSRAARESAESALLGEALARYQEKARSIAKALGFPGYVVGQITVSSDGPAPPIPRPRMAMSAMAEAGPPVPVEAGTNTVSVHVAGSVVLGPGK